MSCHAKGVVRNLGTCPGGSSGTVSGSRGTALHFPGEPSGHYMLVYSVQVLRTEELSFGRTGDGRLPPDSAEDAMVLSNFGGFVREIHATSFSDMVLSGSPGSPAKRL
jgi:hypothetical protein